MTTRDKLMENDCILTKGQKISLSHKRNGHQPPSRKGVKLSEEIREKMRQSALRKFKNGFIHPMKGKHHSEESKEKNRLSHIGKPSWNKGKEWPEDFRKIISESVKGLWKNEKYRKMMVENHMGKSVGPLSGAWLGGKSFEPYTYEFNKRLKQEIKERDLFHCQGCKRESSLTIHHIDYDKTNCEKENLITLCRSCNAKANYRRESWLELYKNMIAVATSKRDNVLR